MSGTKIDVIKRYLAAAKRRDFDAMLGFFTEDFVYRIPGRGPLSGTTTGQDAAIRYYGKISEITGGTYTIVDFVDWLESAERVALIAREHIARGAESFEWTRIIVFVFRGDRFCEALVFDDDVQTLDERLAAWS